VQHCLDWGQAHQEGTALTLAEWATALMHNSRGRHDDAFHVVKDALLDGEAGFAIGSPLELVEAAALTGRRDAALKALDWIANEAHASGTDWGLGIEARCRALVNEDDAPDLFEEAIVRLDRSGMRLDLARTQLLYGEWLSQQGARRGAIDQLYRAHALFVESGARAFAERSAAGLRATGGRVKGKAEPEPSPLTDRQAEIARLASSGLSNPDIAAELFISPRTVEYHLRKVYAKLGVSSRHQLSSALA
jgi:DNA-binding CsgD family transcriptional regulator